MDGPLGSVGDATPSNTPGTAVSTTNINYPVAGVAEFLESRQDAKTSISVSEPLKISVEYYGGDLEKVVSHEAEDEENGLLKTAKTKPPSIFLKPSTDDIPTQTDLRSPAKKLFKRQDDSMDKVLHGVDFETKFMKLPEFVPDDSSTGTMSLPTTPSALMRNFIEKHKQGCAEPGTPVTSRHPATPKTPATAGRLRPPVANGGDIFFGSGFNVELEAAKLSSEPVTNRTEGDSDGSSLCSPRTPKTPLDSEKSASRKLLDQRRQCVMELFEKEGMFPTNAATASFQSMHSDVFPNKSTLQLKIREVRQKLMSAAQSQSPLTPSAASTPGATAALLTVPQNPYQYTPTGRGPSPLCQTAAQPESQTSASLRGNESMTAAISNGPVTVGDSTSTKMGILESAFHPVTATGGHFHGQLTVPGSGGAGSPCTVAVPSGGQCGGDGSYNSANYASGSNGISSGYYGSKTLYSSATSTGVADHFNLQLA